MTLQPQNRDISGRFVPGVSGNPGGRPIGLSAMIRESTRDGREIADFMLAVFRDKGNDLRMRADAATWLADRAFGKPSSASTAIQDCERGATTDFSAYDATEILREKLELRVERQNSDIPDH